MSSKSSPRVKREPPKNIEEDSLSIDEDEVKGEPITEDEDVENNILSMREIEDSENGEPLEQPVIKRQRIWNPCWSSVSGPRSRSPLPGPPSSASEPQESSSDHEASQQWIPSWKTVHVIENTAAPSPTVASSESPSEVLNQEAPAVSRAMPPSPAMSVECGGSNAAHSPHRPPARARPRQKSLANDESLLQYGSEEETDSEGEEFPTLRPFMPRVLRTFEETPEDEPGEVEASPLPVWDEGAVGPTSFYNFSWRPFPVPPILPETRRETFASVNVGPTTPLPSPYDAFVAIWDEQIMAHIASETNRYAQQYAARRFEDQSLGPHSRIAKWVDTDSDEMYVYFAIVLAMGVVVKSKLTEYWSGSNDIFRTPGFSAVMSLSRFQLLSQCLHFNNNEDMVASELSHSEAKLFKIQPIISHLNTKFSTMYNMEQNIALDESLMGWSGCLDINQYISNKKAKIGVKTYEVCESQTGYLWRFEIHAHKKTGARPQAEPLEASTAATVLRLTQGVEHKGHTIWMDNYYNSPALARKLKTLGFDCVGTLRTNRRFVPHELHELKKTDMRPGQITGCTSGDVDILVWRDMNRVAVLSTYHGDHVSTDRSDKLKPAMVFDYNVMMGGVDKKDQLLAMYPIERKRTKVWYKKLFRRFLNVTILNAFILVRKSTSNSALLHRDFRIELIQSLLEKHGTMKAPAVPPILGDVVSLFTHYPDEIPLINGQRKRRLCSYCKKRTYFFCAGCKLPVCAIGCFTPYHRRVQQQKRKTS